MRITRPTDPVEQIVYDALVSAGVEFTMPEPPDFRLSSGLAIECKRMYTPRTEKIMRNEEDIIVIQGINAAQQFANLITSALESSKQ